jgi:hypothetical protein
MGIRTPDLLIANETLYQLSYTPNLINFRKLHNHLRSKKDACLYRHEINGNYYAIKKIRSKIKTHALRSESRILPLRIESSLSGNCASGCLGSGKTSFQPCERSSR